jgi:hypothetical protein
MAHGRNVLSSFTCDSKANLTSQRLSHSMFQKAKWLSILVASILVASA